MSLIVKVAADASGLNTELGKAERSLKDFAGEADKAGKSTGTSMFSAEKAMKTAAIAAGALAVAAIAAGAAMAASLIKEGMRAADEHAKLARQLGITNTELAVLKRASDLSGLSVSELTTSMRNLARVTSDAIEGTGEAAANFDKLGISAEEFANLNSQDQIIRLGDAFSQLGNRQDRVAMAMSMFGRSGMGMINLMEDARGTFERASDEVEKMGLALSDIDSKAVEQLNDNVGSLGAALSGMGQQIAATLARPLRDAAAAALSVVTQLTAVIAKEQELRRARQRIGTEEEQLTDRLTDLIAARGTAQTNLNRAISSGNQMAINAARNRLREAERAIQYEDEYLDQLAQRAMAREQEAAAAAAQADTTEEATKRLVDMFAIAKAAKLEAAAASAVAIDAPREALDGMFAAWSMEESALVEHYNRIAAIEKQAVSATKLAERQKTDAVRAEAQQRAALQLQAGFSMLNSLVSIYANIGEATEKNEEKLFNIRKAAAIAGAVVNTAQGVTQALAAFPPPFSFAAAGLVAAAGAAQVAAIASQSYQSRGGSVPTPPRDMPADSSSSGGAGGGGDAGRTLLVQSDITAGGLFSGEAVRDLIDKIAEAQRDGYRVVV